MKNVLTLLSLTILLVISNSLRLHSQVSLVKDINTDPAKLREGNNYTNDFCSCGNYLFFPLSTPDKGSEIWRTDGTASGTILIKDINIGTASGRTSKLFCNGTGQIFFGANDGESGIELWVSDGTLSGTKMVKDITPGSGGSVNMLGMIGNTMYFFADHDSDGSAEIWKSDGTSQNTDVVSQFGSYPWVFSSVSSGTHIFFSMIASDTDNWEFWTFDGIAAIRLFENKMVDFPQSMGSKAMFTVRDNSTSKYSLWSSDGTVSGTTMVKDFGTTYLQVLRSFNDKVIFTASGATWITDGTDAGTRILTNGHTHASVVIGNDFYGFGTDYSTDSDRIFKTDGTIVEITYMNGDLGSQSMFGDIPVLNNKLIFQHYDPSTGAELGISGATLASSVLLKDIRPAVESSEPRSWVLFKNKIYFIADDGVHGHEIWFTDGTQQGTVLLKDIATGTGSVLRQGGMVASGGKILLNTTSYEPSWSSDLYLSDGTESGTLLKYSFSSGYPYLLGSTDTDLIYFDHLKFYKVNKSTHEVTVVKDFTGQIQGSGLTSRPYHTLGNKLVFAISIDLYSGITGGEYWVTDGTEAGTHLLKDINPGSGTGVNGEGAILNSKLLFNAFTTATGNELWITDGTESETALLKEISPGTEGSNPSFFTTFKDRIFFSATDNTHGTEIWTTDGTPAGTSLLIDLVPGAVGSNARNFTPAGDVLLFIAYDSEKGWCLWKTDGTPGGTLFIKDIHVGKEKTPLPTSFSSVGNKVYFACDDGVHGLELWVSDGTEAGTYVIDLSPGKSSSNPTLLTPVNGTLYFQSQAAMWRTSGTLAGTEKVADFEPIQITSIDNWVYFIAPHPEYGVELFKVPFSKRDQQITFNEITPKVMGEPPFKIEATASSGLPVAIIVEEELAMENSIATIRKPGSVKVTAQQSGDALFNPATPISQTFCIAPAKPVVTLSSNETALHVLNSNAETGNQWYNNGSAIAGATNKTFEPTESGSYQVKVTVEGCASELSGEKAIVITLSEEELSKVITCYPNPAREVLYINNSSMGMRRRSYKKESIYFSLPLS